MDPLTQLYFYVAAAVLVLAGIATLVTYVVLWLILEAPEHLRRWRRERASDREVEATIERNLTNTGLLAGKGRW